MISYVYKGVGTNVWSIGFPGNFSNQLTSSSPGGYPCLQLMPRWQDLPVFCGAFRDCLELLLQHCTKDWGHLFGTNQIRGKRYAIQLFVQIL